MGLHKKGFKPCCNNTQKVPFSLIHKPKPIELVPQLRRSIERMLWYIPGINSIQSYDNYLIDDPIYSNAVFEIIAETIKISLDTDVKIKNYYKLDQLDEKFFSKDLCLSCQKILLTRNKKMNETNLRALLRHIRNAIAHGSFTVIGDLVYFKDTNKFRDPKTQEETLVTTAIIKVDILALDKVLKQVEEYDGITQQKVLAKVFLNLGYRVQMEVKRGKKVLDLILEKNGKKYGVEIKESPKSLSNNLDNLIERLLARMVEYKELNLIPVFVFDRDLISFKAKSLLKSNNVIVLDRQNVAELVEKKDILF